MEDPWQFIRTGHFQQAVAIFTEGLDQPNPSPVYSNRGIAYLNLGDLTRAREDFLSAEGASQYRSCGYRSWVGVCDWLEGREPLAAKNWLGIVESITRGEIHYTDGAGGVGSGCLLWFAAAKLNDMDLRRTACNFLEAKLNTKGGRNWIIDNWPGPIARFLVQRTAEETLIEAVTKTAIRRERELCQAFFYIAANHLADGDFVRYRAALDSATHIFVPNEREFYLAQFELERCGMKTFPKPPNNA